MLTTVLLHQNGDEWHTQFFLSHISILMIESEVLMNNIQTFEVKLNGSTFFQVMLNFVINKSAIVSFCTTTDQLKTFRKLSI